ncbi:methyltransferase domain-containing protein [Antarctobacter heliothermus]|uniref:Methyltransferase domain-containing protein n=1 Tax=Antarctobacter heliothermus TaxID=74033 RepID=A0A239IIG2_9RHOB|nr:methyltransferase domain-containing protein [Antarctobacter heliothermus]SNS93038.1 Methyltransferase domain-containing protein [Antarctobacter heliothermus]
MTDLYLSISDQPDTVLDAIAASMDDRAKDPAMQEICAAYMGKLPKPGARVLEVGCGNGASTESLLRSISPAHLTAVDPAEGFLARARARFADRSNLCFAIGDAVNTQQPDAMFDVVVAHTVYSHLPDPRAALAEAFRVLKPGGTLAIFDGDYATNSVALFDGDPLQTAMTATQRNLIHDPYIMRRLPRMMVDAGFADPATAAHGFVQTRDPAYMQSLIARGVAAAAKAGDCGTDLSEALVAEAARRAANRSFYGAILFISAITTKPI